MITEEKINQAFKKQINMLIVYLLVVEFLFYAQHLYFRDKLSLETEIFTYLVFHVCIAVGITIHFMRKALIDLLVVKQEHNNEKN